MIRNSDIDRLRGLFANTQLTDDQCQYESLRANRLVQLCDMSARSNPP